MSARRTFMQRSLSLAVLMSSLLIASACGHQHGPSEIVVSNPPPPPPPDPELVGVYSLTITADSKCADLPEALKKRTYQATLESNGEFVRVWIVGGGFATAKQVGDLNTSQHTLSWNNLVDECDGSTEPLSPTSYLM